MTRKGYDTVSRVLLHAFLLFAGMQVFAVVMLVGLGDCAYAAHSSWFPMPRETFTVVGYAFLGLMKVIGLSLFLTPWIAMRLNAHRVPE